MFNFLDYSKSIEKVMQGSYSHSSSVLQQGTDLGTAREHFVKEILLRFLPRTILLGSGEIIDGKGNRSGQQDLIIYRADFPVITSFTPVNTYLAEGVIATIEVKSDISKGSPNLYTAFGNIKRVAALNKSAKIIKGDESSISKLQDLASIKTYIVGYAGWKSTDSLLKNFTKAVEQFGMDSIPHLIYQPGVCILRNDGFINPKSASDKPSLLLQEENPFSVFLHHLLKAIMLNTNSMIVQTAGSEALMLYYLDHYFNFNPALKFQILQLTRS